MTLLFSVGRYVEVLGAYMNALEARQSAGLPLAGIASVASFFPQPHRRKVDAALTCGPVRATSTPRRRTHCAARQQSPAPGLRTAGFNSRSASRVGARSADSGAMTQRLLWASTGTKDPQYSDVRYAGGTRRS